MNLTKEIRYRLSSNDGDLTIAATDTGILVGDGTSDVGITGQQWQALRRLIDSMVADVDSAAVSVTPAQWVQR